MGRGWVDGWMDGRWELAAGTPIEPHLDKLLSAPTTKSLKSVGGRAAFVGGGY